MRISALDLEQDATTGLSDFTPFQFHATDADISDLHRRLGEARWPAQLADTSWESGVPTGFESLSNPNLERHGGKVALVI